MLYKPSHYTDYDVVVERAVMEAYGTAQIADEVKQYVRVLEHKKLSPAYIMMAISRYAKMRGKFCE
jgi:oxalate decarboxylase/phosphoglucose isomerase-like protein (cupin superfamily)